MMFLLFEGENLPVSSLRGKGSHKVEPMGRAWATQLWRCCLFLDFDLSALLLSMGVCKHVKIQC